MADCVDDDAFFASPTSAVFTAFGFSTGFDSDGFGSIGLALADLDSTGFDSTGFDSTGLTFSDFGSEALVFVGEDAVELGLDGRVATGFSPVFILVSTASCPETAAAVPPTDSVFAELLRVFSGAFGLSASACLSLVVAV